MYFNDNGFFKLLFTLIFLFIFFVTSLADTSFTFAKRRTKVRRDLLQEQFPDLHEYSEVQPHLNTFIISSGTKQTSGSTDKGMRYLVSPSFPHP